MRPRSFDQSSTSGASSFGGAGLSGRPVGRPPSTPPELAGTKAKIAAQRWQEHARQQGYDQDQRPDLREDDMRRRSAGAAQRMDSRFEGEASLARQADIRADERTPEQRQARQQQDEDEL